MLRFPIYYLRKAFDGLKKSPFLNTLTILTITISLLVLGAYFLLLDNLNQWIGEGKDRFAIHVYLKDKISLATTNSIKDKLQKETLIRKVQYRSPEQAMQSFSQKHDAYQAILGDLEDNPFPASFVLLPKETDPKALEQLAERVGSYAGVEEVDYGAEWLSRYSTLVGFMEMGAYIVGILVMLGTLFVVFNTIRLKVYSQREEIEILELVGGSRSFISIPFILEGMLQGTIGAAFSLLFLLLLFQLFIAQSVNPTLHSLIGLRLQFLSQYSLLLLFACGALAGLIGGLLSVRRIIRF